MSVLMCEPDHNSVLEAQSIPAHDHPYILLEISTKEGHQHHHIDACTNSYHVLQSLPAGVQGHIGTWHRDLSQGVSAGKPALLQHVKTAF